MKTLLIQEIGEVKLFLEFKDVINLNKYSKLKNQHFQLI